MVSESNLVVSCVEFLGQDPAETKKCVGEVRLPKSVKHKTCFVLAFEGEMNQKAKNITIAKTNEVCFLIIQV